VQETLFGSIIISLVFQCSLDLIVGKCSRDGGRLVIVIQQVTKFAASYKLIGVIITAIEDITNNQCFMVDRSLIRMDKRTDFTSR